MIILSDDAPMATKAFGFSTVPTIYMIDGENSYAYTGKRIKSNALSFAQGEYKEITPESAPVVE